MTVLVVEVHRQGVLIGADRNITEPEADGTVVGQSEQHCKVMHWPDAKVIAGAAGMAQVGNVWMDDWLRAFAAAYPDTTDSKKIADSLRDELQAAIPAAVRAEHAVVVHLAAFEEREGVPIPFVHYVHNLKDTLRYIPQPDFISREEMYLRPWPERYGGLPAADVQARIAEKSDQLDPFWFHQTGELPKFNTLRDFLVGAMHQIVALDLQPYPTTIDGRAEHLKMKILTYGAYHESFYAENEQYVGGGVDVESLAWPSAT